MSPDGSLLEELWTATAAEPAVRLFRTTGCGVDTPDGPVLLGTMRDGTRHLLVPIDARHTLREEVTGSAVALRRRILEDESSYRGYATLGLLDARLADLFTALCVEIVARIAAAPDRAVAAIHRTLADWRSLLSGSRRALGPGELAGLFGELEVLRSMVELDPGAVIFWTGHAGTPQDFHRSGTALEVKTTTTVGSRAVRIHGAGQLDVDEAGRLFLVWFRLSPGGGRSVPDLVDAILASTDDEAAFLAALGNVGYLPADREMYARRLFTVEEHRAFEVGPGFPRITATGLTGDAALAGVERIAYDVNLDSAPAAAARIRFDPVRAFLGRS